MEVNDPLRRLRAPGLSRDNAVPLGGMVGDRRLRPNAFYLKDGDRVVFYGDSITDQRLYTSFVESYVITRFPHMKISFVHSGVGGDRVTGGMNGSVDARLACDVVAYKPNVVAIMLGMNDGEYHPFDQQLFIRYTTGYLHIIQSLKNRCPACTLRQFSRRLTMI